MFHRVELSSERYNTLFGRFAHVWDKIRLSTHHKSVIKGFDLVKSGEGREKTNSILIIFVVYITKSQYGRPSSWIALHSMWRWQYPLTTGICVAGSLWGLTSGWKFEEHFISTVWLLQYRYFHHFIVPYRENDGTKQDVT